MTNLKFDKQINPFNDTINFIKFPELKLFEMICKALMNNNPIFRAKNSLGKYTLGQLGNAFKPIINEFVSKVDNFLDQNTSNSTDFNYDHIEICQFINY